MVGVERRVVAGAHAASPHAAMPAMPAATAPMARARSQVVWARAAAVPQPLLPHVQGRSARGQAG
eukprot:3318092-Prymnesium_polylepis.1